MIMLQLMNKSMNPQYGANVLRNLLNRNCIFKRHKLLVTNPISNNTVHTAVPQLNANAQSNSEKVREPNQIKELIKHGPSLKEFMLNQNVNEQIDDIEVPNIPYVENVSGHGRKVYFKVYGCQMNVNDTEVVWSILKSNGYQKVDSIGKADVILLVTCSIRDNAEQKVWAELYNINAIRRRNAHSKLYPVKIGLLGCMAERLKSKILERGKLVDVIAGPDSYKDLPRLLSLPGKEAAINVVLSFDETYADVVPVRLDLDSPSAYVTIMRGCDNMCTYCIVPFTRGRERSRPVDSILEEVRQLSEQGVKEVTLLGQNVNSYRDLSQSQFTAASGATQLAKGFKTVYKNKQGGLRFSDLLDKVSLVDPEMRIRFTSPHPKDFPDEVLQLIGERPNICKSLHVPAQSGNSVVLERMRRGYTREAYIDLIHHIREIVPNVSLSSDFIAGFCGETEAEFEDTLSLIELVKYNVAYLFSYSMREKTTAHRRYKDDVELSVKQNRLIRMIDLHRAQAKEINQAQIGQVQLVLIEGLSKKSEDFFHARNDGNIRVLVPNMEIPEHAGSLMKRGISKGDYVAVRIDDANCQTLRGKPLYHSTIREYASSLVV